MMSRVLYKREQRETFKDAALLGLKRVGGLSLYKLHVAVKNSDSSLSLQELMPFVVICDIGIGN
jgi:hypothetical protein